MIIYVSHSSQLNYVEELYKPLWQSNLAKRYNLIFPHDESNMQFPSKKLFKAGNCDLVIAEISYPSTGVGIEMGWANAFNIPVIGIHKQDAKPSPAVHEVVKEIIVYTTMVESVVALENAIAALLPPQKQKSPDDIF